MEIDYIAALKKQVRDFPIEQIRKHPEKIGDDYCVRWYGVPTWWLKFELGYPTSNHRKALRKLEKEGLVISYQWSKNQIHWWPVLFCDEIRNNLSTK